MPTLRLSADDIERCYGYGELAYAGAVISEWLSKRGFDHARFDLDTRHPDPAFHAFCIELPAIEPPPLTQFCAWISDQRIAILNITP